MDVPLIGREHEMERIRTVLDPDGPAVLTVRGPAGVGKSRLLAEAAAAAAGWRVVRIYGAPAVARIPFGAVGHLLDLATLPDDPTAMFLHVRQTVVGGSGEPALIVVDDAHDLDDGTAAVVEQIAAHGEARVLLAARIPPDPSPAVGGLVARGADVELGPLSRGDTARLLEAAIGRPVHADLAEHVWNRTLGLPLFVTVLAREAAAADPGADGSVPLGGDPPVEPLHAVVRTRMARLDTGARTAVEVVAIAGPVPGAVVDSVAGVGSAAEAMAVGYLVLRPDGTVGVAHPVHAEAILEVLPGPRRKELAGAVVDAFAGAPSGPDRIRLAMLTLDAGRRLLPDDAAAAAVEAVARADYRLGETLAAAALDGDPGCLPARIALARTLGFQGRAEEADRLLGEADPATLADVADVALARGHVLAFLLGRAEDAIELLAAAAAGLPDDLRAPLDADRALYGAMRGTFGDAVEAGERVLANPEASDLAKVRAATNLILARAMLGRFDGLAEVIDEALILARRHREVRPLALLQSELTVANWLFLSGGVRTALEYSGERVSDAAGPPHPVWQEWHALMLDAVGDLDGAVALQRRAIAGYDRMDPFRLRPQAVGILALHHGQAGRVPDDLPAMVEEAEARSGGEPRLLVWIGRGKAWLETALRGPAAGAAIAAGIGRHAAERDHVTWAALAFHDAVRFGLPGLVRAELEGWTAGVSGAPLVETMRDHAVALDEGDAGALAGIARRFAGFGAVPLAVEAWAQQAKVHEDREDGPGARLAATRAALLGARTPALRTPALHGLPDGLTDRELDVASRAAAGATSREISDELFLSVRTVDNHLASIYRKLGLSGREELADVLAEPIPGD